MMECFEVLLIVQKNYAEINREPSFCRLARYSQEEI
jgi:hypothetical protein